MGTNFTMGSTSDEFYGAERFMDTNEVVIVTVNYRLGPLGFLCLGTDTCPGNQVTNCGTQNVVIFLVIILNHRVSGTN